MFVHQFKYRFKALILQKSVMFWTFAFPIILVTFFFLAFSNINSTTSFSQIPVGVVDDENIQSDEYFNDFLQSFSEDSTINIIYFSEEDSAIEALNQEEITGYIYYDTELTLAVKENGINQTIVKEVFDYYVQKTSSVENIIASNPSVINNIDELIDEDNNYISEKSFENNSPDSILIYYYALISMASLYGAFMGLSEVVSIQANQSSEGARISLAPRKKSKIFLASFCAAIIIQFFTLIILLLYMNYVLNIDFGNQLGFILIATFAGALCGVSYGSLIGIVSKKSFGFKIAIVISSTMIMSFLAGLMNSSIKYIVTKNVPVLRYINPANLISDAFYSLYYFNTYNRYFLNICLLFGMSVIMCVIVALILRRQQYESI